MSSNPFDNQLESTYPFGRDTILKQQTKTSGSHLQQDDVSISTSGLITFPEPSGADNTPDSTFNSAMAAITSKKNRAGIKGERSLSGV